MGLDTLVFVEVFLGLTASHSTTRMPGALLIGIITGVTITIIDMATTDAAVTGIDLGVTTTNVAEIGTDMGMITIAVTVIAIEVGIEIVISQNASQYG